MKQQSQVQASWYATRTIPMPDLGEQGIDSILIWIEHRKGDGAWAVGRASDLTQRSFAEPREHDYIFTGFEIDDALDAANGALEDDLVVSEADGIRAEAAPFLRRDLEEPLNEWFWGRRAN
ncbi:MAG: hypothetical protein JWM25_1817 [Thermoleophilia bacterium]|nr:hypothetical protein [Thermoleophilia bacterium]